MLLWRRFWWKRSINSRSKEHAGCWITGQTVKSHPVTQQSVRSPTRFYYFCSVSSMYSKCLAVNSWRLAEEMASFEALPRCFCVGGSVGQRSIISCQGRKVLNEMSWFQSWGKKNFGSAEKIDKSVPPRFLWKVKIDGFPALACTKFDDFGSWEEPLISADY